MEAIRERAGLCIRAATRRGQAENEVRGAQKMATTITHHRWTTRADIQARAQREARRKWLDEERAEQARRETATEAVGVAIEPEDRGSEDDSDQ